MRKLASIQRIKDIQPIEGKDLIGLAQIEGWQVIVRKQDFNPGDLCIYIEIDSVMPEKPEFEFLRTKDFRIKTMKMAGTISQGICFPLSLQPQDKEWHEGDDVTDVLGIKQYEPTMDTEENVLNKKKKRYPSWLMRFKQFRRLILGKPKKKGGFPDFLTKTDETRIQNVPHMQEDKEPYVVTEKIDGCSATFALVRHKRWIFKDKFEYIVCSRNLRLPLNDGSIYYQVSEKYGIENKLRGMIGNKDWIAIQGECIGPKIQGNKYRVNEPHFFVFNVITPHGRMGSIDARNYVGTRNLNFVPIVTDNYILPDTVQEMLEHAHGTSEQCPTLREGVVVRSKDGKKSFKAVDPLFLLRHNE